MFAPSPTQQSDLDDFLQTNWAVQTACRCRQNHASDLAMTNSLIERPRFHRRLRRDWNLGGKITVTFMRFEGHSRHTYSPYAPPPQHAAQPHPGGANAAQGGDGGAQEGQRPARPRAQPLEAELRGAETAARPGPEGAGRPPAAATAGATKSMSTHTSTHRQRNALEQPARCYEGANRLQ